MAYPLYLFCVNNVTNKFISDSIVSILPVSLEGRKSVSLSNQRRQAKRTQNVLKVQTDERAQEERISGGERGKGIESREVNFWQ
jgi:hypothetical protein